MTGDRLMRAAAVSAALAIAAGAFGAHIMGGPAADLLRTGALYQLIHAVAVIALAPRRQAGLLLIGSLLFAFSLYALALGGPRWMGAITPIGGISMIIGWLWLGLGWKPGLNRAR
jgi:uncharacterized membrane protein YgdD (TMEM256/DUF423 family)